MKWTIFRKKKFIAAIICAALFVWVMWIPGGCMMFAFGVIDGMKERMDYDGIIAEQLTVELDHVIDKIYWGIMGLCVTGQFTGETETDSQLISKLI